MSDLQSFRDLLASRDPDFGKVMNDDPGTYFAFEVVGRFTIQDVMDLPDGAAAVALKGIDDHGNPVHEVPLKATSRTFDFPFSERTVTIPYAKPSISVWLLLEVIAGVVALKMAPNRERFGIAASAESLLKLPLYRFYYSREDGAWIVTFDTFDEPATTWK